MCFFEDVDIRHWFSHTTFRIYIICVFSVSSHLHTNFTIPTILSLIFHRHEFVNEFSSKNVLKTSIAKRLAQYYLLRIKILHWGIALSRIYYLMSVCVHRCSLYFNIISAWVYILVFSVMPVCLFPIYEVFTWSIISHIFEILTINSEYKRCSWWIIIMS